MNGCRLYRFLTIVILIISITTTSYADDDQSYINCNNNSYKCGDITISYPFYGALNRPAYCGFPGFKLDCQNDILTMTVSDISYQVFYIDYALESLTVVRRDYWDIYCQKHLIDTSIDSKLFNYGSKSYNLSLYYGCPAVPSEIAHEFSCPINGTKTVGYYLTRELTYDELPILTLLGTCSGSVKVPVFESAGESLNDDPSVEKLVEAIRGGFGLEWIADSKLCKECVDSGGICGYAVDAFVCYCSDKPYATICSSSSRSSRSGKRKRIAFTIGLAVGGAIIACIGVISLVFCVRKRRNQLVSQSQNKGLSTTPSSNALPTPITNFSRTTGSYPSSLSTDLEKGSVYFGVQVFTYSELEEATNNFDSSRELGDGGFGVVYLGKLLDGRVVAVKRLYENNFRRVEQFINEVQMLARLRHQNLVTLYGCTSRRSQALVLVYEYISNGTVADHLHGKKADSGLLTWPVRLSIAIETASALAYLHKSDIIHRDVKTTNILLDDNFRVKVADFGLSRLFPSDVTHVSTAPQGTPGYVDPEYYQCYQLTDKSDVYSFGVVLVELISSLKAVDTSRHRHNINLSNMGITKIQNQTLHELVDPCLGFETDGEIRRTITMVAELAFQCLQQDTDVRPSMEEVLESLKMIETDEVKKVGKAEVMDIQFDDVGLLKNMEPPPFSPISVVSAKWVSSSSTVTSSF